ncbi:MAG: hypothetical protein PHC34_05000 [Candidatus Gastranaerophilales bacterium]|nr:hypothetical protein [Candidatus Gastranaerophilales bacterium]
MSKTKAQMNIFKIIFNSIGIYLKNFIPLSKAMLFPVFGQIFGMAWILFAAFYLSKNLTKSFTPEAFTNNILFIFLILIVAVLPGFIIYIKAFWEYMIAMVSLNSMISNIVKQGHLKDAQVHNRLVKVKSKEYIGLLLFVSLIWLVGLMLPVLIFFIKSPFVTVMFIGLELIALMILTIISIYLSISYQVFAFENLSVFNTVKRSWNLVEGNFWRTFFLGFIVLLLTSLFIPKIFLAIADKTLLTSIMVQPLQPFAVNLSDNPVYLSIISSGIMGQKLLPTAFSYEIIKYIVQASLGGIITAFILPLGSACYTLLYLDIVDRKKFKSKKK